MIRLKAYNVLERMFYIMLYLSNHSLYQSLVEAMQQTATISHVIEDIYLRELMAYAENWWVHYPTPRYRYNYDVVIAVPSNIPKRANTRASQLEELALDCRAKEAYNLGTFAHHSMMYSETTRDEAVTGWKEHEKEGGRMLLPVYRAMAQYVARLG